MQIQNSLTRKKELFEPLKRGKVNIYTCGVTVYDECHIGHARSLYIFDVMRRYLEYKGFKVRFVRNITDIDDKIINRANELNTDWKELVDKYITSYKEDLKALGVREGMLDKDKEEPRATKSIPDMVKYVKVLVDKGFAYEAGGDVYFDVRKFSQYGQLSGQNIDQMREGVRIDKDEKKKDPLDFALWKKSKENEPSWESPWGKGRPGWHIECSVMSQKFLKTDTLDIHAGGRDLIFPHHENEIAQAEAYTGKEFAKYWIHHGLLTINGQKMAKSAGNFVTIKDALDKYNPDILKLFFLSAHYASAIDFSWRKMDQFKKAYERFAIFFNKLDRQFGTRELMTGGSGSVNEFIRKFEESMDDDFNTPQAVSVIFELLNFSNKILEQYKEENRLVLSGAVKTIYRLGEVLGLSFEYIPKQISDSHIDIIIKARLELRKQGKYKEADKIREGLEAKGIILEDTKEGTTWRKI